MTSLLEHLTGIARTLAENGFPSVDTQLIGSYTISYVPSKDTPSQAPLTSNSEARVDPETSLIVLTLFQIINSDGFPTIDEGELLILLLRSVLLKLSLTQTSSIFDALDSTDFQTVFLICLNKDSHPLIQCLAIDLLTQCSLLELRKLQSEIITHVFELFAAAETPISVVSSVDHFFDHVTELTGADSSIFYKVFTNTNTQILFAMKQFKKDQDVLRVRLVDLLTRIVDRFPGLVVANKSFFNNLYVYPPSEFESDDVFYVALLAKLYSVVFSTNYDKLADDDLANEPLMAQLEPQIETLFLIYQEKMLYGGRELREFFGAFSRFNLEVFQKYNSRHSLVSQQSLNTLKDIDLLQSLNPQFFKDYDLSDLHISERSFPLLQNLVSCEAVFEQFVAQNHSFTVSRISELSDTSVVLLISSLAAYPYSTKYLVDELRVVIYDFLIAESPAVSSNVKLNQLKADVLDELDKNPLIQGELKDRIIRARSKILSGEVYSRGVQAAVKSG